MAAKPMTIQLATHYYELWLQRHSPLIQADLARKHRAMAGGLFPFFRATFYRWMQYWPGICRDLTAAPRVLAVGDLHIENFGTWRDAEGRLIWGINDFDESWPLPYTVDLVRLAASALLAIRTEHLSLSPKLACQCILDGYSAALRQGGRPVVIGDEHRWFVPMMRQGLRDPVQFWQHLRAQPACGHALPRSAVRAIRQMMPTAKLPCRFVHRIAGLGSLGKMRFVGLADWQGGPIAREAKALTPSACIWVAGVASGAICYQDILRRAVRCADPFVQMADHWLVRRLAPDCSRIELASLDQVRDEEHLLHAMGWETANVHLGTSRVAQRIRRDLATRGKWLRSAARAMLEALEVDWKTWKQGPSTRRGC